MNLRPAPHAAHKLEIIHRDIKPAKIASVASCPQNFSRPSAELGEILSKDTRFLLIRLDDKQEERSHMKNARYWLLGLGGLLLAGVARTALRIRSEDPSIWEFEIRRFEAQDRRQPPPTGGIVFVGSSSIRFWSKLALDMEPLRVLNRGFGGAHISHVTHFTDRIITPYSPQAVVFYAGENDMAALFASIRKTPLQIQTLFHQFCAKLHARFPALPIYFVSIKPPKLRRKYWAAMQQANALVKADCESDPRLHYVDIVPPSLDAAGQPRPELFRWDGIHLNAQGYKIWASVIKPILLKDFPL
jgi:lysophospholipase L1-like esterase